ncbi:MAG: tRNA preQ1(34) S-adenosylmethionine ribosyltransferase-isomerase QueA [Candidatus Rokuibacteriota bacterium]|nr:MAG: tRNA preQ1(34) S-adenosylmethionine ribosyltransferase-isomerase QueA [Candidatus Rokubacteria bacterium]
MDVHDFEYELPPEAIAQAPALERDAARLLLIDRARGALEDHVVRELPELLRPGDCVVVNDSRVIPARVLALDASGHRVELLVEARLRIVAAEPEGPRIVERLDGTIDDLLASHGMLPLPPYIARHAQPTAEDRERYQTVYARSPGSVAAPTAGLHFTPSLLDRLRARSIEVHALTLHVGPATFRPIKSERVEDHILAAERVAIPASVADAVSSARNEGRRVVAVGTTTTRALESAAGADGRVRAHDGTAEAYITPGYRFRVVDALVTNFHLPRSSLLVLVCALAGRELILKAYQHALRAGYRFYSYGDATLIV